METPPARGRDAAMLQRQLDSTSGQRLHRRRVSRSLQLEDAFFTPTSSPHNITASNARFGTQTQTQSDTPLLHLTPRDVADHSRRSPRQNETSRNYIDFGEGFDTSFGDSLRFNNSNNNQFVAADSHATNATLNGPPTVANEAARKPQEAATKSPVKTSAHALSSRRRCAKCGGDISGHFVRALGEAYHIDCFTCEDCGVPCAAKFFPLENKPLCERCYFKRQNLLCYRCGNSLRGSYITALDRKYHVEHFTCSLCTTVFGPEDSYFEYNGDLYCRAHYSSLFAFHCEGCKSPILRQFVETYRGGKQQQWHPECYMIFKFWSVKISDNKAKEMSALRAEIAASSDPAKPLDARAANVIAHEEMIDRRTMRTWTTLCGFEEACASEISKLVQNAVNGNFREAYDTCARFVAQIKVLFAAIDVAFKPAHSADSANSDHSPKEPGKEAKTLCRKIVSYMSLLSKTRQLPDRDRVQGLTQQHLLALASAIAHYLKVLIRQGLAGSLKSHTLSQYLTTVGDYSIAKPAKPVSPFSTDQCLTCNKAVEDRCYRQKGRSDRLWHARSQCFKCSKTGIPLDLTAATVDDQGKLLSLSTAGPGALPAQFVIISRLEQYIVLLHVALARLDLVLSNNRRPKSQEASPSPSDQQNIDKTSASTPILPGQRTELNSASKSSPITQGQNRAAGSATSTLERTSMILHEKAGLTLDDIRRIVAAEQAKITVELSKDQTKEKQPQQQSQVPNQRQLHNQKSQQQPQQQMSSSPVQNSQSSDSRPGIRYFGTLSDEEYAWVRQIAQAMVQPYANKYLKRELEEVSSTYKTPTLWGRMGKVFAKDQDGRVFGQPLERLVSKYGVDSNLVTIDPTMSRNRYTLRIPSFVDDCVQAMRQKDMSAEGVFRKNGNIRRLREFVEKIDRNPDENGLLVDESPIQLAALLKKFLRDLPDPLLSSKLAPMWAILPKLEGEERIKVAQLLVCILPRVNRSLLEVLVSFLNWVSGFAHVDDESGSKMDIPNLATVLGPTLLLSNEEAEARLAVSDTAGNGSSESSSAYKNVSEPVKFLIADYGLVAQLPSDVTRCLKHVKGTPRKLSTAEIQDLLNQA